MKITAGELRSQGHTIPDNIPDCATTTLLDHSMGKISSDENGIHVGINMHYGPFEWVTATVVVKGPERISVDPKGLLHRNVKLDFVQQQTPNDCLSACIALITKFPLEKVVAEFHDRYRRDWTVNVSTYFDEIGLKHTVRSAVDRVIEEGFIYTARVSSLNNVGGGHAVVIHNCPEEGFTVYDPNKGREGQRYYVFNKTDDPLSETLTSYITTTQIAEQDLVAFWNAKI